MAPVQPSLGPPRDKLRVFRLDKFNGDNFAEWSFRMENVFDHYDLLEVMEGTEKRPENDPKKSPKHRPRMVVEGAEDEEEEGLDAATTMEAAEVAAMAMTTRTTDTVAGGSTASVIFATRADTCGAIATNSLMDGLLLKAKRVEEQGEGEEEAVEGVAVAEVELQT
ncbi:unnamed protein product [Closterium sp. NIES-54]